MKKAIFLPLILVLAATTGVFGQNPVPDPDTISNPVQEGDPAVRHLPPRLDYVEDLHRITPEEVPDPVRQTLESSAQYTDWQKAMVYHDKNKDEYVVEFKEQEKTTTYRFNKEGQPVVKEE
jgi:hypothetical protein